MSKVILTYGTFDVLHVGHVRLLERAKAMGDTLIVAVSTQAFNELKHKQSFYSYEDRKYTLNALSYVDLVIPEESWDQKLSDVQRYGVDTVVMGYDWRGDERFESLRSVCDVVYLPRTEHISSTLLRERDLTKVSRVGNYV